MASYTDAFLSALQGAREQFEQQFLASRECQRPEYWLRLLGQIIAQTKEESEALSPKQITVGAVLGIVSKAAVLAALTDFCLARFGEEWSHGRD